MSKPLSDLSQKDVFQYFSLEKRKTLAKSIKRLRKLQAKVPFRFDTVAFCKDSVRIDNFNWQFYFDKNLLSLENDWIVHQLEMVAPNGKLHIFNDDEPFLRFLNYYLNRKGTRIRSFCILEADFKCLPNFREISIFNLQMAVKPGSYEHWAKKFLEDFKDFEFCEVFIKNTDTDNKFMMHLKDMKINILVLWALEINTDFISQLDFPRMELIERVVDSNGFDFLDNVKKFIENNPDRNEVYYQVHSAHTLDFDWNEFTTRAKTELGAKHRYRGYEGYLSIELINGREVQIWCRTFQFALLANHWYMLEAMFEETKPSVPCPLTGHPNLLARMHFYQMVVTEKLQNYVMNRQRAGNPHRTFILECLYFINNHHLRFLTFAGSFGFSRLVLWSLPKIPSRNLSLLASTVFSIGVTWRAFRAYTYDCRKVAVLDVAAASHSL